MKRDASGAPLPEAAGQSLVNLRIALLRLHKVLLDDERAAYERAHGRASGGEMLQLVIHDERFAWLHSISELIVSIDEMMDADEAGLGFAVVALFRSGWGGLLAVTFFIWNAFWLWVRVVFM